MIGKVVNYRDYRVDQNHADDPQNPGRVSNLLIGYGADKHPDLESEYYYQDQSDNQAQRRAHAPKSKIPKHAVIITCVV